MPNRIAQAEIILFYKTETTPLFLLLKRIPERGGFWQPITGGINPDEDFIEAAKREVFEETGVEAFTRFIDKVHYFEFESDEYGLVKEYVFAAEVPNDNVTLSSEHSEYKWCQAKEAIKLLKYDTNKEALKKLLKII